MLFQNELSSLAEVSLYLVYCTFFEIRHQALIFPRPVAMHTAAAVQLLVQSPRTVVHTACANCHASVTFRMAFAFSRSSSAFASGIALCDVVLHPLALSITIWVWCCAGHIACCTVNGNVCVGVIGTWGTDWGTHCGD